MTSNSRGFKIRKSARRQYTEELIEKQTVANLEDLRLADDDPANRKAQNQQNPIAKLKKVQYDNSEDNVKCYRFPHMRFCGCEKTCLFEAFESFAILPQIHVCGFVSGTKIKQMIQSGITHVLNITSKQYTKRTKFFKYLNLDVHNNTEEDIKKFFRITNRFIQQSLQQGGTILIHSANLELAVCFAISYLIGVRRQPIKASLQQIKRTLPRLEIQSHFYKQLESYDLEKLAFVTIKRE